jgi:hypothetical protein
MFSLCAMTVVEKERSLRCRPTMRALLEQC